MDTVGVGSLRSPFKPLEFYIFQGFFSKFNWKRGADWVPHELSPNYGDPRCQRLAALAVQTDTILFAYFALFSNSFNQPNVSCNVEMMVIVGANGSLRSPFKLTRC